MIKINYPDPADERWIKWREKAEKASKVLREYAASMTQAEYDGYAAPEIKKSLYQFAHEWLMQAFNGKCAFCEANIEGEQAGEVEHFRPKGAVHDDDGKPASFTTRGGARRQHPGYFWLVYEWSNLLLACSTCNGSAKRNFFPVEKGRSRALCPDGIEKEGALFINPLTDDPAKSVRFEEETGMAVGIDPRGIECVERLKLNRDGLLDKRRATYDIVKLKFEKCMGTRQTDPDFSKLRQELEEWRIGKREYAAQARVALDKAKAEYTEKLTQL